MDRRDFFRLSMATGIAAMAVPKNTWSLEYYPIVSDKKCAVLYGTWCGTSRDAAVWVSEGMGGIADVFDVREAPDLKVFDHIVVGGSIRSGNTTPGLQDYLGKNKDFIKGKVRGLFAVCGNGEKPVGPQQKAAYIDNHLATLCGAASVPSRVFNGRITKALLDPGDRQRMEAMYPSIAGKPLANYDLLKRADCLALGREILASMPS